MLDLSLQGIRPITRPGGGPPARPSGAPPARGSSLANSSGGMFSPLFFFFSFLCSRNIFHFQIECTFRYTQKREEKICLWIGKREQGEEF